MNDIASEGIIILPSKLSVDYGDATVYTEAIKDLFRGGDMTEASKRASMKYDSNNTVQLKMKLNKKTDADILEKLDSAGNKQGYIKALIRADINADAEG